MVSTSEEEGEGLNKGQVAGEEAARGSINAPRSLAGEETHWEVVGRRGRGLGSRRVAVVGIFADGRDLCMSKCWCRGAGCRVSPQSLGKLEVENLLFSPQTNTSIRILFFVCTQ